MLLERVRSIIQTEGIPALFKRAAVFITDHCFQYGKFYIYQHSVRERNESDFLPRIEDFTFHIVTSNEQADELARSGFECRTYSVYSRKRLDKGAIAFCFFAGKELAHIGWVALSKEAKNTFDPHPYRVDFANGEACTGGSLTIPKFERRGLMRFGYYKRLEYLRQLGMKRSVNVVNINNIASQKAQAVFKPEIRARAFYLKILWWQVWSETPA